MPDSPAPHVDPPAYLSRLDDYLAPIRDSEFYEASFRHFTTIDRFAFYLDVVERHHPIAHADVLDLGTGVGGLLLAARQRGAARLVGIEVDPAVHVLATARVADTSIQVLLTDGGVVPMPDASFDIVMSIHVIEHCAAPNEYLGEIRRLLRPGGVALVACPNRFVPREVHGDVPYVTWLPVSVSQRFGRWRSSRPYVAAPIQQQYSTATMVSHHLSPFTLRRLARQAGLDVLEANPTRTFTVPVSDLGAWGRHHPWLRQPFHLFNNRLLSDVVSPRARSAPDRPRFRALAWLFNWELLFVLRRPA